MTGDYIYQHIDLLDKLGLVNIIHKGFYDLADQQRLPVATETWERLHEHKQTEESVDEVLNWLLDIETGWKWLTEHKSND